MTNWNAPVLRLLGEQRKRCFATIMGGAETSPWWGSLNPGEQAQFREQVRSALAVFYDLTRDVVKVTEDDGIRNELALDLIRSIHSQQAQISDALKGK